jgi:hypothetical protein
MRSNPNAYPGRPFTIDPANKKPSTRPHGGPQPLKPVQFPLLPGEPFQQPSHGNTANGNTANGNTANGRATC